jgi:RNA polymerase sigma-70 factor (ECF subfamily)
MAQGALDTADRSVRLAALLGRVAMGDQRAFEALYGQTSAHLYAVALRIVREPTAAEEILQEAYVSVWHHAGSYDAARSQPITWLISIVRNRCLDHLRRREIDTVSLTADDEDAPELDVADEGPTPADLLMRSAEAHSVRDCVETLDAGQKQAIALGVLPGLSHASWPPT